MDEKALSGYKSTFDVCHSNHLKLGDEVGFSIFRDDKRVYGFVVAHVKSKRPDLTAIGAAALLDPDLCAAYLKRPKCTAGYSHVSSYMPVDIVDSRHILMSTMIFSKIGRWIPGRIIEIGGGFGNWVRLNSNVIRFKKWTIIDLPFVTELQRWYLKQEKIDLENVEIIDTDEYLTWRNDLTDPIDLVIGTHSLSELSWADFEDYVSHVVCRSRYLFYATQLQLPSEELVAAKLERLDKLFDRLETWSTENGVVLNILYRSKTAG